MELIREFLNTYSQRIRSPIFGSIILAFIAVNWQSIYYLVFSSANAINKFAFWDTHTNWRSLFAIPIAIGILMAIITPFASELGARIASGPMGRRRMLQVKKASELAEYRDALIKQRNTEIDAIITDAEQHERVEGIQNKDTRNKLRSQIDEIKQVTDGNLDPNSDGFKIMIDELKNLSLGGGESAERTTAAMANLAEGIQGLVKNLRAEQQTLRDWIEDQRSDSKAMRDSVDKLLDNKPKK